jgi:tripartite-type tricarboxylate transporter receptor subunit TctC
MFSPASSGNRSARHLAPRSSLRTSPVPVAIGAARGAKAAPDGYTMILGNLGTHGASKGLFKNLSYDPRTDFEPVMLIATAPMMLLTRKDLPVATLQDFITLAKKRRLNMGSAGVGSMSHLTLLLFAHLTGARIKHVPYRTSLRPITT